MLPLLRTAILWIVCLEEIKMVAYLERDLLQCRLQVCLSLVKEVQGVFFTDVCFLVACWFILKTCSIFHGPETGTDDR
jgi:uncharacterized protein (DUF1810 family)